MPRKNISNEEFISKAISAHQGKYTYEHTKYVDTKTPIVVTCKEHGDFLVKDPRNHMKGYAPCPSCSKRIPINNKSFVERAKEHWGEKYDYSGVNYSGPWNEVKITCLQHGVAFMQKAYAHLQGYEGCPQCRQEKAWDTKRFVLEARRVHGDEYDYSKVNYINNSTPVTIICKHCGHEFSQRPYVHLGQKGGCKLCGLKSMATLRRMPIELFRERATEVHLDRNYDFSHSVYVDSSNDVSFSCPDHGEVIRSTASILSGCICPKCAEEKRLTTDSWITRAMGIHGNKYDYSRVHYVDWDTPVKIICHEHGEFSQLTSAHFKGCGCPRCAGTAPLTTIDFIQRSMEIHGSKYDYSRSNYIDRKTPVIISCPNHGEFLQTPGDHMSGCGCPQCGKISSANARRSTTEEFVSKARQIHGDKYIYDKVQYVTASQLVTIVCPEHGEFTQSPNSHLRGAGCPICNESHLEKTVRDFLVEQNIVFKEQWKFDWLIDKGPLRLDFYLPEYSVAIECQGIQHFQPVDVFGGYDNFLVTQQRDLLKRNLCEIHGIKTIYYSELEIDFPYHVVKSLEVLLGAILK